MSRPAWLARSDSSRLSPFQNGVRACVSPERPVRCKAPNASGHIMYTLVLGFRRPWTVVITHCLNGQPGPEGSKKDQESTAQPFHLHPDSAESISIAHGVMESQNGLIPSEKAVTLTHDNSQLLPCLRQSESFSTCGRPTPVGRCSEAVHIPNVAPHLIYCS